MRKTYGTVDVLRGNQFKGPGLRGPASFKGQLFLEEDTGTYYKAKSAGADVEYERILITTPVGVVSDPAVKQELNATIGASIADSWVVPMMDGLASIASPRHTPTIVWSSSSATSLSSPVEYKPVAVGGGSQVTNWNGQNDSRLAFHPGVYNTSNGANADLGLYGSVKPAAGSGSDWPLLFEFQTSSDNSVVEIAQYGSGPALKLWVNGHPVISDQTLAGPSGLSISKKVLLTFPVSASRRIRVGLAGGAGLVAVRVPTGQSITKPTDSIRSAGIIGDSFINGAAGADSWPSGGGLFDTWAMRTLQTLGANRFALGGIGGSGFTAGATYVQRVATMNAMNLDVMVVTGSVNDGANAAAIQAAAETMLAQITAPELYVVGVVRGGVYVQNHDALKAAAETVGATFIDMRSFIHGTGNVLAPNGTGNADVFIQDDGVHPTLEGHRAIARAVSVKIAQARF